MDMEEEIPFRIAEKLCLEIRNAQDKVFRPMQCWGCMRYSKGDPMKMCFSQNPHNTGCKLVNKAYRQRYLKDRGHVRI